MHVLRFMDAARYPHSMPNLIAQYQEAKGKSHFRALKHLVGYLHLHPDILLTFNQATVSKTVQAMNFKLLEPEPQAQISAVFIQFAQPTLNASHDSDPDGCDNLFQLMDTTTRQHNNARDNIIGEVNRLAPPVTECLVDANLSGGL
jgi:hypothetical protein